MAKPERAALGSRSHHDSDAQKQPLLFRLFFLACLQWHRRAVAEQTENHLDKGEALGGFQYGGSTVCMVFEPKVNIKWEVSQLEHVLIKSKIAEVY